MADYAPGEPDSWTWPDAYDGDDVFDDEPPDNVCWACGGRGFVRADLVIEVECHECGGTGEEA